jgi:hypothetical protein
MGGLPRAAPVALYFMPIAATTDKKSETSPSLFARAVAHLRARTGRIDAELRIPDIASGEAVL